MGCDSDGRVISWEDIQLNLNGLSPNDVAISIYDDNGAAVSSWQDLDVDSTGYLDISGLTVAESSTTPSIQIVGLNGTTIEELEAITGTVTFEAEEPELCFGLRAVTNCPDEEINNPAVPDVPSGIVEASSITFPKNGSREVGSKQRVTIAGTNSGNLCAASAWSAFVPTLAATGFDTVPVALGGLAAVAAGIGAALYTKRRRNG
jgi:LPXTG-motif cell wall-anchored protein